MAAIVFPYRNTSRRLGIGRFLSDDDIADPFDFWNPGSQGRFSEWLWQRLDRHSALGWVAEIEREAEQVGRPAMEMFFEFLDEFRAGNHQLQDGAAPDSHTPAETQQPLAAD
ncbi:hypothetical protein [Streptomyces sp. NBC_01483]|uniref:hypothetical protein n=1 Tax=Streptomyces sp. NBC_01483 TaxID=2903883 RepID=UPI002E3454DA|nr:hypothetical protein [Streptomyces sp. NBC_01483]